MGCAGSKYKVPDTLPIEEDLRPEGKEEDAVISGNNFVLQSSKKIKDLYRIMNVIGKGSFGEIVACTHLPTKQFRAIKVLYKTGHAPDPADLDLEEGEVPQDTMDIEELKNEIAMMKSLDHVNILKMYEFFEDEKRFYLAMEICRGGTVMDIVHASSTDEHESAQVMRQIISCVNYMHSNRVIHRDLKPDNVLLVNKEEFHNLKIIDFGLATWVPEGEMLTKKCGTPNFMAPEIYKGNYSYPADMWACGVIAYMLFTHKVPFLVMTCTSPDFMLEMVEEGLDTNDIDFKYLSPNVQDFILKLLEPNPDLRLTAAEALKHVFLEQTPTKMYRSASTKDALKNLSGVRERNMLAQATHSYIASQLVSQNEHDKLIKIFQSLDVDDVGVLKLDTFKKGYEEHLGITYDEETTVALFRKLDSDNSGSIDYSEFVAGMINQNDTTVTEKLKHVFKAFDLDGNGCIEMAEVAQILSFGSETRVNGNILDSIMKEMDTNNDGKISMKEFMDALTNGLPKLDPGEGIFMPR